MIGGLLEIISKRSASVRAERWFTGRITLLNTDGSYEVLVREINIVLPRVFRSGSDRRRLLPGDRVAVRARGVLWEVV